MTTAQAKKSEDKRLFILNSSINLVLRKGFVGVGLQEIVKNCSIPKGSFYYYFESKEAFGCALLDHYICDYQDRLNVLWNNNKTAKDKILSYFSAWIHDDAMSGGWAQNCLIVKLAAEVSDLSEDMRLIIDQGVKRLIARIAQLIEEGIQEGSIVIDTDADAFAELIYQMWLGAALLYKLQQDKSPLYHALHSTQLMLDRNN